MFHLVKGSVYLPVVLGASFSFLYTSLVTMFTYIVLIFDIYIYIYIYVGIRAQDCILGLGLWPRTMMGPRTNKQ